MHPDASAPRERCTAIVALWTLFLTFHLVRDYGIANSHTPRIMTTSLTVTSRIHSLERVKVNLTKMGASQARKDLKIHKHPKPMSPVVRRHVPRRSRQLRLMRTIGHPLSSRWISVALLNSTYSANNHLSRLGKVAIIRDIGAVTYV